jgi:hypothetical protein
MTGEKVLAVICQVFPILCLTHHHSPGKTEHSRILAYRWYSYLERLGEQPEP